jgi:hypothetical protein
MVLLFLEEKRSNKKETVQYLKKAFLYTSLKQRDLGKSLDPSGKGKRGEQFQRQ